MITINLLPWRKSQERKKAIIFLTRALGFFLTMIFIFFIASEWMAKSIEKKEASNALLKQKVNLLEAKVKEYQFISVAYRRLSNGLLSLLTFQLKRRQGERLIERLQGLEGDDFEVEKSGYGGGHFFLTGFASSESALHSLVEQLKNTKWATEIKPPQVSINQGRIHFQLQIVLEESDDHKQNPTLP